jgi:hypothetical protein
VIVKSNIVATAITITHSDRLLATVSGHPTFLPRVMAIVITYSDSQVKFCDREKKNQKK